MRFVGLFFITTLLVSAPAVAADDAKVSGVPAKASIHESTGVGPILNNLIEKQEKIIVDAETANLLTEDRNKKIRNVIRATKTLRLDEKAEFAQRKLTALKALKKCELYNLCEFTPEIEKLLEDPFIGEKDREEIQKMLDGFKAVFRLQLTRNQRQKVQKIDGVHRDELPADVITVANNPEFKSANEFRAELHPFKETLFDCYTLEQEIENLQAIIARRSAELAMPSTDLEIVALKNKQARLEKSQATIAACKVRKQQIETTIHAWETTAPTITDVKTTHDLTKQLKADYSSVVDLPGAPKASVHPITSAPASPPTFLPEALKRK